MIHHSLAAFVQREFIFFFVPNGDGAVHLHGIVNFDGSDVSFVEFDFRLLKR